MRQILNVLVESIKPYSAIPEVSEVLMRRSNCAILRESFITIQKCLSYIKDNTSHTWTEDDWKELAAEFS